MQKAQSSNIDKILKEEEERRAEMASWRRDLGFLEAWKRVADQKAHLIFTARPIYGPTLSDQLKKSAVDEVYRLTWLVVCNGMTDEERRAAWRANRDAITKYSGALAEKAAAENWKRASARAR